ncbi:uncharacterized protein K489DRAFT_254364 [Dissoconium aciculare CBS 342.82]|uniref:Uncharacterized protein n=1 Tax=Dissoconium aciculare CBS 342.82 TaxID=1314786 RepID=A0A6J3M1D5_9PEZI|nr:uncharacterized protein K489DRAFT_254364 [Dissoconium aciculare CBS 342.82]KAF1821698.1 hypothetical protein K489DRAFT_254364 [Dissoconium aciculare CBS 342.82]
MGEYGVINLNALVCYTTILYRILAEYFPSGLTIQISIITRNSQNARQYDENLDRSRPTPDAPPCRGRCHRTSPTQAGISAADGDDVVAIRWSTSETKSSAVGFVTGMLYFSLFVNCVVVVMTPFYLRDVISFTFS